MELLVIYVIGIPIMFAFLAKRLGEDTSEEHDMSRGRIMMSLLWPLFLPIIIFMWLQTESEERKERERSAEWKRRARGEN
jgi:hypothetical protein